MQAHHLRGYFDIYVTICVDDLELTPEFGQLLATFDIGILGIPLKRTAMALADVIYNINSAWFSDMRLSSRIR